MTILPSYIIEELRKIEEELQQRRDEDMRPRLYIPIPLPAEDESRYNQDDVQPEMKRGPIIIDMGTGETIEA